MKAFICVYRHSIPDSGAWGKTRHAALFDARLKKFLAEYKSPTCFYDWGDDPSFFAAEEMLGNVKAASWGVCRRNVRIQLLRGDFVIFFCGKQNPENTRSWNYYFIGCMTVKHSISRRQLWTDSRFSEYRGFYNVLAKYENNAPVQHETFHNYHDDWKKRIEAGYIIFDPDPTLTKVNLKNPLHVAQRHPGQECETWFSDKDTIVREVENILFDEQNIQRRLRIFNAQWPHAHIRLPGETETLQRLRSRLFKFI